MVPARRFSAFVVCRVKHTAGERCTHGWLSSACEAINPQCSSIRVYAGHGHCAKLRVRQRQPTFGLAQNDKTSLLDATTFCGSMPPSAGTRSTEMHGGVEQHEDSKVVCECHKVQRKNQSSENDRLSQPLFLLARFQDRHEANSTPATVYAHVLPPIRKNREVLFTILLHHDHALIKR
jgi:hypothetical protein